MYERYFGFMEKPFQLVPNPVYLFLSQNHEEALAHLRYAASQKDGFVEITGEVGTGKTTLCRAFLDCLGHEIEVAYIFNPKLTPIELLKAIIDELGIHSSAQSLKELIDCLNRYLLQQKAEKRSVIVLIDEAQNLSLETLEQLRLLSNLETSTSKLIQIILVGQPELRELLDSSALRQLNQRISLSFHLKPLSPAETKAYILHRLWVASGKTPSIISPEACASVYSFSRGVPRLINIVCDRSLLVAFGSGTPTITRSVVKKAIQELHTQKRPASSTLPRKKQLSILAGLTLALFLLHLIPLSSFQDDSSKTERTPAVSHIPTKPLVSDKEREPLPNDFPKSSHLEGEKPADPDMQEQPRTNEPPPQKPLQWNLKKYFQSIDPVQSRIIALQALFDQWRTIGFFSEALKHMTDANMFFRRAASLNGLQSLYIREDLDFLKRLNLPAALKCSVPNTTAAHYVTLVQIEANTLTFKADDPNIRIQTNEAELAQYWNGAAYVLWNNFFNLEGTIPRNRSQDNLFNLKKLLQEIGHQSLGDSTRFDEGMRKAVQEIQARHGLQVDGLVGPKTKIALYNELQELDPPPSDT